MATSRAVLAVVVLAAFPPGSQDPVGPFHAEVDIVDVTATVTDRGGRFVRGLGKDDFVVYDDGVPQSLTGFGPEREPVSLGLLLDASGSMDREKLQAAQAALEQLVSTRLPPEDELFFIEFGYSASLTQEWTTDRGVIRAALRRIRATGDTALYDAVALALPTAQSGRHRKKATPIADELGRQYRLSYARQGARDGRWHAIRVEVRKRGVQVRARSGYVAN